MKLNLSRTNAAVTLFVAAIFFIVANIAADYLLKREDKPLPQLSADQINLNFLSSLKNLGIKESWVKSKTANRNKKNDSLKYNYKVEIPADLPIAVVLSEINEMFDSELITVSVDEKGINGKTNLEMSSGRKLKLIAQFYYNSEIIREKKTGAVILTNIFSLTAEELAALLTTPEQFAALITPDKEAGDIIKKLKGNGKEYIVFLDDNITDLEFKLKGNFNKTRTSEVLKNIAGKFKDASLIMVDEESDLYNSSIFNFIKDEITGRKIMLIRKGDAAFLQGSSEDINETFLRVMHEGNEAPRLFLIDAENYFIIQQAIVKLRKIGYKFINPSLAVKEKLNLL
ncbi:MAG: hypothetical protein AUK34_15185 [Ignavibacteria bacterium CG2_30_36_16]|nr:hypothetical protein [Ignavibacteria bacterium]OIP54521.1 MAG: hypothetical protein AUK34_15185 [Ignavibacteria bacterium CG2_30_36_16]PJB00104.1 MAG: hypothetical protein CO127_09250 [Ignavibacteria bacterium CG_4_9_14_3_um_filter_36_18]